MKSILIFMTCVMLVIGGMSIHGQNQAEISTVIPSSSTTSSPPLPQTTFDPLDNAAHFRFYQNESNIIHWYEWWYMNVKCSNGNNLVVVFFTTGDLNNPLLSLVGVVLIFMNEDGTVFRSLKTYPGIQYDLDYNICNISIDGDRFQQDVTGTRYRVTYQNPINDVTLNLSLVAISRSITQAPSAIYRDEWMSWLVAIPLGKATGTLSFRDRTRIYTYTLDGRGYHDHNWGIARKLPMVWDWGEFSDDFQTASITYGMASIDGQPFVGGLYFSNASCSMAIYRPDLNIDYLEWASIHGVEKPTLINLHGSTSGFSVNITIELFKPYIIASLGNYGIPYLMGTLRGNALINGQEYIFRDVTGFYEHHCFNLLNISQHE
jgi:hypothetical protein